MPLGSLTVLLIPPMLPGPCGIPLTPASCASDFIGAVKLATNAKAKKADLPNIGHSPVRVPNEPAGSPFLVRMHLVFGAAPRIATQGHQMNTTNRERLLIAPRSFTENARWTICPKQQSCRKKPRCSNSAPITRSSVFPNCTTGKWPRTIGHCL